jgi:hypothetical protein
MKCFIAVAFLLISGRPATSLLLLDINLKKPVQQVTGFTMTQYLQQRFPIYASEVEAIIDATDKVVKQMDREPHCNQMDTVATAHSMFLLTKSCEGGQNFTVTVVLVTKVEESQTSFGFKLVKNEMNKRKAQQKLLDFATYLAQ